MTAATETARELERTVLSLINQGETTQTKRILFRKSPGSPRNEAAAVSRTREFLKSQLQLREGRYQEAIDTITTAQERFGPHISLTSNLVTCYYLSDEIPKFKKTFLELKTAFKKVQPLLGPERRAKAAIVIAQLLEEEGSPAEALETFHSTLTEINSAEYPELHYKLLAQIVRLEAAFRIRERVQPAYLELLSLKRNRPTLYLSIEVQHALLWADLFHVGIQQATQRLQFILENRGNIFGKISDYDHRLLYFDFVEELLILKADPMAYLPKSICSPQDRENWSLFEVTLEKMATQPKSQLLARGGDWIAAPTAMPVSRFLTLLGLAARDATGQGSIELRRQLNLILESRSPKSQKLWLSRIALHDASYEVVISYDREKSTIHCNGQSLSLARKRSIRSIIEALLANGKVEIHALGILLWNKTPLDSYHEERLRNLLLRANQLLAPLTGIRKAILAHDGCLELASTLITKP